MIIKMRLRQRDEAELCHFLLCVDVVLGKHKKQKEQDLKL